MGKIYSLNIRVCANVFIKFLRFFQYPFHNPPGDARQTINLSPRNTLFMYSSYILIS